jgi:hypothetical protein
MPDWFGKHKISQNFVRLRKSNLRSKNKKIEKMNAVEDSSFDNRVRRSEHGVPSSERRA